MSPFCQLFLLIAAAGANSADLLLELHSALGQTEAKAIEQRVPELTEALRPIFESMPHNGHGKMGNSVARYVLHRLFMQKGWSVSGLDPAGQAWTEGSPAEMLRTGVSHQVVDLFNARIQREGLDLEEAAILAATFKSVVRAEMVQRLLAAYRHHSAARGAGDRLEEDAAYSVLDTFLASHVVGENISSMSEWEVNDVARRARIEYAGWGRLQTLARDIKHKLAGAGPVSFSVMKRIVEEIGESFGASENRECQMRKADLLTLEDRGSGRVRLSEFYKANMHEGKWHFGESSGYLRQLGALDESDPKDLKVIIPNYVHSKSNCIDPSSYYSVCCLSECDSVLGQLEAALGVPAATPSAIAELVAAIPSATVPGNRTLPQALLRRLDEVAALNDGLVPLHGRLFSQWLHHAYPRECPFPHISGTTSPLRVSDWAAEPGNEVVARPEEMLQHIETGQAPSRQQDADSTDDDDGECAPWMEDEELIAPLAHVRAASARKGALEGWGRRLCVVAGAVALFLALRSGAVTMRAAPGASEKGEMGDQTVVYHV